MYAKAEHKRMIGPKDRCFPRFLNRLGLGAFLCFLGQTSKLGVGRHPDVVWNDFDLRSLLNAK